MAAGHEAQLMVIDAVTVTVTVTLTVNVTVTVTVTADNTAVTEKHKLQ